MNHPGRRAGVARVAAAHEPITDRVPETSVDVAAPCEDCGAPLGGRAGCDRAFQELGARAHVEPAYAYRRRAIVDAYALQHAAYTRSVKSLAAHLCGLCVAVERPTDPRAARAVGSELRLPAGAVKPEPPGGRGTLTLATLLRASTPEAFRVAAELWFQDVWITWREHHALARAWLDHSIASLPRGRR